ncbi:MAG: hypothetical protein ACK4TA_26110 [Saprospiraceae bacterium]
MWRITVACIIFLMVGNIALGQSTYQSIVRDTIVTLHKFPANTYLLDGKKLNLSVMEWFMTDFSDAHDQISLAILSEQVSVASYSIGALFGLTGLLVYRQDPHLGNDLMQVGSIGLGSGIAFSIFSGTFKKRAVRLYNEDVRKLYNNKNGGDRVKVNINTNGIGFCLLLQQERRCR